MKRAAQRVVIRDLFHSDVAAPLRRIAQKRFNAAITFTLMFLHDQAGEQLPKCEVVAAEFARVLWQRIACEEKGSTHHLPWRFAGQHPASSTHCVDDAQP